MFNILRKVVFRATQPPASHSLIAGLSRTDCWLWQEVEVDQRTQRLVQHPSVPATPGLSPGEISPVTLIDSLTAADWLRSSAEPNGSLTWLVEKTRGWDDCGAPLIDWDNEWLRSSGLEQANWIKFYSMRYHVKSDSTAGDRRALLVDDEK